MNRNWNGRAIGGLPILSAAMLSIIGLTWGAAGSGAAAQTYSGPSNEVIVNYDVLNSLPGQAAPYGARGAQTALPGSQPKSQFLPGYAPKYNPGGVQALPPYSPYGTLPPPVGAQPMPLAPGLAGLAPPPAGAPTSVLTTLGPDGRPLAPIKLKKPGSQAAGKPKKKTEEYAAPVQKPQAPDTDTAGAPSEAKVAVATPPAEPAEIPATVPMPEATPQAPAPGVNDETAPPAPAVATSAPAVETPTPPAEQPAEAAAAPAAATQEAAKTPQPPAEDDAAKTEETPAEEAAATAPPPAPGDNQPAPPIPQGGIRIVFPVDLNEVPAEANSALDDLAAQMQADENMRVQIMCYASGTEDTESKARRKSLARCINIRQYLFKKDVRTTRMDVRALGLKSEGQPADRVDIVPANS